MKAINITPIVAFALCLSNSVVGSTPREELICSFESPPIAYSPMPLWVWNDKVTEEKIDRDLRSFKENGIHGAFVHPKPGLITEYLSEEWFHLWGYVFDKAAELEMELWIYDENSFPSGFAGGHVAEKMPDSIHFPNAHRSCVTRILQNSKDYKEPTIENSN